ncbi:hypothetical protein PVBG_06229 [Plasmodium vivax Brazil I]|uniref:Uncharacterized protein n=1 Tax=Plasmodium vivax (strain Brazil I) TaxID=1033975 RepID=A0A0J9VB81_PLAV1|nr:hypothetical protein PVBG_06229 [Plasmodium vivax Brazil I]
MSLINLDYYEMKGDDLSETRKFLKEIPLYNLYVKIDEVLSNNETNDNCEECNRKLSGTTSEELQLIKLCKSFCNVISKRSDLNLYCKDSYRNISCVYMNLLLYSNVINITQKFNIIEKFYTALQTISKTTSSDKKFCDIVNYKFSREKFKNYKYLYEFLFTYDYINDKITQTGNAKNQLYCNHIKENFRLYNEIKEKCSNEGDCQYNSELNGIKKRFGNPEFLSEIYSKCNYVKTQCKQNPIETDDIPCLIETVRKSPPPVVGPNTGNVVNQITNGLTYSIPTLATLTMLYKVSILIFY